MSTDSERVSALMAQLRASVDEPFESLRWTLTRHPVESLGDPGDVGGPAWHLAHVVDCFRHHARAVLGAAVDDWPPLREGLGAALVDLRGDIERFAAWCEAYPDRCGDVAHGETMTFERMVGMMTRHVVWHAAAVHYACLWRDRT